MPLQYDTVLQIYRDENRNVLYIYSCSILEIQYSAILLEITCKFTAKGYSVGALTLVCLFSIK